MGLLDDAIREHLELKRRRGADPGEVERAEREALGPVRRGPEEPLAGALDDLAAPEISGDDRAYEPGESWDDVGQGHEAHGAGPELEEYEDEYEGYEDPPSTVPAPALGYVPEDEKPPPGSVDRGAAPPVQFAGESYAEEGLPSRTPAEPSLDDELSPDDELLLDDEREETAARPPGTTGEPAADGSEDVLEETPEFLQDTPDHDRLWFEQRPPRDFDFDG